MVTMVIDAIGSLLSGNRGDWGYRCSLSGNHGGAAGFLWVVTVVNDAAGCPWVGSRPQRRRWGRWGRRWKRWRKIWSDRLRWMASVWPAAPWRRYTRVGRDAPLTDNVLCLVQTYWLRWWLHGILMYIIILLESILMGWTSNLSKYF